MSLWGATVITNLLSAVPFFGQDLVESNNATEFFTCFSNKALIYNNTLLAMLPTVGTVSPHALKKGKKIKITGEKIEYLSIPYQFIAFLAGFIDGDGYIQIIRTTKGFIAIKLVITLSLEDISTLEYIQSVLKLGKLIIKRDIKNPTCSLIINRTDLQEIVFPLLIHHGIFFLTDTRRAQFDKAIYIFKNDIKLYEQVSNIKEIPTEFQLPITPSNYLKLPFFKNWLVGFTNASNYQEVKFFIQEKPLTYKRVKSELKKLFSNRKSFNYLLNFLKNKNLSPDSSLANNKKSSWASLPSSSGEKI